MLPGYLFEGLKLLPPSTGLAKQRLVSISNGTGVQLFSEGLGVKFERITECCSIILYAELYIV